MAHRRVSLFALRLRQRLHRLRPDPVARMTLSDLWREWRIWWLEWLAKRAERRGRLGEAVGYWLGAHELAQRRRSDFAAHLEARRMSRVNEQ